jgi:hypothetical protein
LKRTLSLLASLAAASLMPACGIDVDNLRPATDGTTVTVTSEYVYLADLSAPTCEWLITYRVAPGTYRAELIGEGGTFYRAPTGALRFERRKMSCPHLEHTLPPVELAGGIFVSDDKAKPALLYRHVGQQPVDVAAIGDVGRSAAMAQPSGADYNVAGPAGGAGASLIIAAAAAAESDNIMFLARQAEDQSLRAVLGE